MRFYGSHSIAETIFNYIKANEKFFEGKVVFDLPAGDGGSSRQLHEAGAQVTAFDLFPENFTYEPVRCRHVDLNEKIPCDNEIADIILCQEGIEHITDQPAAFREMSRVLKKNGSLIITTPNGSNIRSRLSFFLNEAEHYKLMPVNEVDSLWLSESENSTEKIYYGHAFLSTFTKIRLFAELAGLSIAKIHYDRANNLSALLAPILYPFIALTAIASYRRALRKLPDKSVEIKNVYKEVLKMSLDPRNLLVSHIFIEFTKTGDHLSSLASFRRFNKLG